MDETIDPAAVLAPPVDVPLDAIMGVIAAIQRNDLDEARRIAAGAGPGAGEGVGLDPRSPASVVAQAIERIRRRVPAAGWGRGQPPRAGDLTDAEIRVLWLLRGRLTLKEIGGELCVSVNTIKTHTKSIYRKLGVTSRRAVVELLEQALAVQLRPADRGSHSITGHGGSLADG